MSCLFAGVLVPFRTWLALPGWIQPPFLLVKRTPFLDFCKTSPSRKPTQTWTLFNLSVVICHFLAAVKRLVRMHFLASKPHSPSPAKFFVLIWLFVVFQVITVQGQLPTSHPYLLFSNAFVSTFTQYHWEENARASPVVLKKESNQACVYFKTTLINHSSSVETNPTY